MQTELELMQDINLYQTCNEFECIQLNSREEWLKARETRIGGSEASSLIGINPYQSLRDLWLKKKGHVVEEIDNEATRYGNACEPILRELFKLKHPELEVEYQENTILYSNVYDFMSYSPDSLSFDGARKGIVEFKTSFIRNSAMHDEWKDKIPMQYFVQVLHGLIVTGFEYVDLMAELRYLDGNSSIKQYHIERKEVLDDIEYILEQETNNWQTYFLGNVEPKITFEL